MEKLRIAFAEPAGKRRLNIYALVRTSRGIPLLAAILQKIGYQVDCYVASIRKFSWQELMAYDVVGFSALSCTIVQTHEMIKQMRVAGFTGKIIIGGPHATEAPDDSLRIGADIVVRNEGDKTLVELILALHSKESLHGIKGITWIDENGSIHSNPNRPFLTEEELSQLPLPAFDSIKGYERITLIPFSFSRGCPYACEFCGVAEMYGHKYRATSVEWRLNQLREFKEKYPDLWARVPFFFTDDNFFGTDKTKKITIEFLERAMAEDLITPAEYVCQMRVADASPEISALLKQSKCGMDCLGVESVDDETLKLHNKHQTGEDVRVGLANLHRVGIKTLAMTIVGADTDTFRSSWRSIKQLSDWGVTYLQVLALTPLIGTPMTLKFQEEGREYSLRYENHDGMVVTHKPEKMKKFAVWFVMYFIGFFWFYGRKLFGRNPKFRRFLGQWLWQEFKRPWVAIKSRF